MKYYTLTETERYILSTALHVAAEQYAKDAMDCAANRRLYDQFQKQQEEAIAWAVRIEDGGTIQINLPLDKHPQ